jgi:hypothetical protein
MRNRIGVEARKPEVRSVVHQTAILRAYRKVSGNWEVSPGPVYEDAGSLPLSARNRAEAVTRGIEHERTTFGQNIRDDRKPAGRRKAKHEAPGRLMNIALNSGEGSGPRKLLWVTVVAVDCFGRQPAVDVIPLTDQENAGVGGVLGRALPIGVLGEKARPFETDLRPALLSRRSEELTE